MSSKPNFDFIRNRNRCSFRLLILVLTISQLLGSCVGLTTSVQPSPEAATNLEAAAAIPNSTASPTQSATATNVATSTSSATSTPTNSTPGPLSAPIAVTNPTPSATVTTVTNSTPKQDGSAAPPLQVYALPSQVAQGRVVVLWALANTEGNISGNFNSYHVEWARSGTVPGGYWSVVGIPADGRIGAKNLDVTLKDRRGREYEVQYQVEVVNGNYPVENIWLPPSQGDLLAPQVMTAEKRRIERLTSIVTPKALWNGPFSVPVKAEISSDFGIRRSYNGGPVSDYHGGTDFAVYEGTPIGSGAPGVVALAEHLDVRGNAVIIDHGMGVFTGYYHLSQIKVSVGQQVDKGEIIGLSGETGLATGPHLHWDFMVNSVNVDGMEWTERSIP